MLLIIGYLDILIHSPRDSALVLIHSSELSQAESNCHGITDLDIDTHRLSRHSCVVLLSHQTGFGASI
jgi:hypothetical protein